MYISTANCLPLRGNNLNILLGCTKLTIIFLKKIIYLFISNLKKNVFVYNEHLIHGCAKHMRLIKTVLSYFIGNYLI